MCGRYSVLLDRPQDLLAYLKEATELVQLNGDGPTLSADLDGWRPRYNAAPGQNLPIVLQRDGKVVVQYMNWGLVPRWHKEGGKLVKPINARSEAIRERPMFRDALINRRCLVPMSGFFEWQKKPEQKTKQPFFIASETEPVLFAAGIWEEWSSKKSGEYLETFTVLTEAAVGPMTDYHDRMPIFFTSAEECAAWVNLATKPAAIDSLIAKHAGRDFTFKRVSRAVNSPANDTAAVFVTDELEPDDRELKLF